ncbi:MAG: hypothetical protein R3192_03030 [Woeseiaceae bacterium]|nr:hypothetical protein [Woeseiaceae bacterium]
MRSKTIIPGLILAMISAVVLADLDPWKDYELSESVYSVTTVRVDPNMDDAYLEGIARTWATSNEVAKKLGQIVDYSIFRSDLPQSGDFNLILVVEFENSAAFAPNKARYDAFMAEMGKANADASTEYAQKNYPAMRTITGEYLMREVTLK